MNSTLCEVPECGLQNALPIAAIEPGELTELVRGQEQRLLERIAPLVRRQNVALDLGTVERIDAAGIAALITLYCDACQSGHVFSISNASPRVAEILTLVGVDRLLLSRNTVASSHSGPRLQKNAA
jgi:anti-anti-sigma regulatory factor